jgi:hypothetical protein
MGKTYRLLSRLKAVGPDWVELERPLTANVSLNWAPRLHAYGPQANGCGVEHLTIRFKWTPYGGHLKVRRCCLLLCLCSASTQKNPQRRRQTSTTTTTQPPSPRANKHTKQPP